MSPPAASARRADLDEAVRASFDDSGGTPGTYGSPRVFGDLVEAGWRVSKKTVAASMARQGLAGRSPKRKRRCLTRPDKAAAPIPDLVGRDFNAERVDQRWCGDLTEIPTDEGKLYLATVLDLASRRLPGFALGEHYDSELAKAALCMAAAVCGGDVAGVIFHTDKGGEYVGDLFARACKNLGVTQSMGRVGSALDNAAAESFNSNLEHELLSPQHLHAECSGRPGDLRSSGPHGPDQHLGRLTPVVACHRLSVGWGLIEDWLRTGLALAPKPRRRAGARARTCPWR